jgi:hypothetical protein
MTVFFRAGIRSICVLAPLFGITWIFGIISLDSDLVAFQYLFAILNSLQVSNGMKLLNFSVFLH